MNLVQTLFGKTRRAVLGLFYLHDSEQYYLRQIAALTTQSVGSLQRELNLLVDAGIVQRQRIGNQVFYGADHQCQIFEELKSIFRKTSGLRDILLEAVKPVSTRCSLVFVYGSVAAGTEGVDSDIDVMFIGNVSFAEVSDCLVDLQLGLQREINPSVYSADEFASKAHTPYLQSVITKPKLFLIGGEGELRAVVEKQLVG